MVERVGLGDGRRHHLEATAVRMHLGLVAWQGLLGVAVVAPDAARVRSQHRADQHGVRQQGRANTALRRTGPSDRHRYRPFLSTMDADLAVEFRRAPAECAT
jgi:hypothetical protein